jgi:ornithine cyclodeaminase/alanine dehydrogenase-like protein (mu-crystallin family)
MLAGASVADARNGSGQAGDAIRDQPFIEVRIAKDQAAADIVCCCTTAREPLFDGALVADHATVVAIGSHEPHARETDDTLAARATIVVESRTSALREAGDVILAIDSGATTANQLITLAELIRGEPKPPAGRPTLFKSTGMSWEDAVIASALTDRP